LARAPAELRYREVGPPLGRMGALERHASTINLSTRAGGPNVPATTEHVGSALRMRQVHRSSRSPAAFRTSHLSART